MNMNNDNKPQCGQKTNVNFVLMDFMGFKCEGLIQVIGITEVMVMDFWEGER